MVIEVLSGTIFIFNYEFFRCSTQKSKKIIFLGDLNDTVVIFNKKKSLKKSEY